MEPNSTKAILCPLACVYEVLSVIVKRVCINPSAVYGVLYDAPTVKRCRRHHWAPLINEAVNWPTKKENKNPQLHIQVEM